MVTPGEIAAALRAYDETVGLPCIGPRFVLRHSAMVAALEAAESKRSEGGYMACQAVQHSDEMKCGRCGLSWDVADTEPPACLPPSRGPALRAALARLQETGKAATVQAERANTGAPQVDAEGRAWAPVETRLRVSGVAMLEVVSREPAPSKVSLPRVLPGPAVSAMSRAYARAMRNGSTFEGRHRAAYEALLVYFGQA